MRAPPDAKNPAPLAGGHRALRIDLAGHRIRSNNNPSKIGCQADWRAGATVAILNEDWRVVFDPLQWILEKRQGSRWRARSFCVTKAGLLRCIAEYCGEADIAEVLNLPDWHPDRAAAEPKPPTLTETPSVTASPLLPISERASADVGGTA